MSWIGPVPTWMIRWCLCDNATATASWASVDFDGSLSGTTGRSDEHRRLGSDNVQRLPVAVGLVGSAKASPKLENTQFLKEYLPGVFWSCVDSQTCSHTVIWVKTHFWICKTGTGTSTTVHWCFWESRRKMNWSESLNLLPRGAAGENRKVEPRNIFETPKFIRGTFEILFCSAENVLYLSSIWTKFQDSEVVCKTFHSKEVSAPSDRHSCAGACAFFVVGVACTKQVSWAPVHVQVCTLWEVSVDTSVHVCEHILYRVTVHMRSCMCSLFISVAGGPGWRGSVYAWHLFLAKDVIFDMRKDRGIGYISSLFWR